MLVGRRQVDPDKVRLANESRDAKWAAVMENSARRTDIADTNAQTEKVKARAGLISSVANLANAQTAAAGQVETNRSNLVTEAERERSNKANEQITTARDTAQAGFQQGTLENNARTTAIQGLQYARQAPLIEAQTAEAQSATDLNTSKLGLRTQYMDPKTTDAGRDRIAGLYQAESGTRPTSTNQILPGQKITGVDANGRPVETLTPPQIVNKETGTYRNATSADQPKVFNTAAERLQSMVGTKDQAAAEAEYIKLYGKLPDGYTGGK